MRVRAGDIQAWRAVAAWLLRLPSVVAVTVGVYLVIKKVAFGLGTGELDMIYDVWDGTGEGQSFYRGLSLIMVGAALGLLAPRLSRWIVSVPETGCVRCGYAAKPGGACPECGLSPEP